MATPRLENQEAVQPDACPARCTPQSSASAQCGSGCGPAKVGSTVSSPPPAQLLSTCQRGRGVAPRVRGGWASGLRHS